LPINKDDSSGSHDTILLTRIQAFVADVAGKGPKMFLNFAVCVLPTLSTSLKTSKGNAAPLSTVSDDDSEPTAKKQSGFLIYSFANLFFLVIL
jgi:hypothetical protein